MEIREEGGQKNVSTVGNKETHFLGEGGLYQWNSFILSLISVCWFPIRGLSEHSDCCHIPSIRHFHCEGWAWLSQTNL
jgi:hypothetical protein